MATADVVVVGAGLAGLTSAIRLAQEGVTVEVVARGHAATHWASGGIDVAASPGADTPEQGIARLRSIDGHPYGILHGDVPDALARLWGTLAGQGLVYEGDLSSPIRPVPTAIGGTRPAAILPAAQAAALATWTPDERLVICGFAGFKDFWPEHVAASLTRPAVWDAGGTEAGLAPAKVEALSIDLPGLPGRRNLSALHIARLFDDPARRNDAVGAIASALARTGTRPGRLGLPATIGLAEHAAAFEAVASAIDLVPFEIPLVPPSVPGLRLFAALRAALRSAGGRITIGEPVVDVGRAGRRITSVSTAAATRQRTIRTGSLILATGGIAGGGLVGTADGRLVEPVLGLPVEGPDRDRWLARTPFEPDGHPLERAGIRTDDSLRPVDANGDVVFENVRIAGSLLAGQRYLAERCGDGVAIASGDRAAATIADSGKATTVARSGKRTRENATAGTGR